MARIDDLKKKQADGTLTSAEDSELAQLLSAPTPDGTLGSVLDTGKVAPRGIQPTVTTSTRVSSSSIDRPMMKDIMESAKEYAGEDPSVNKEYLARLDAIQKRYDESQGRIAKAELAAQLGQAFGLLIAGGGLGKLGKAVGKTTGSPGLGEAAGSGLGTQGAGEYTVEMLRKPAPDFTKQREQASDAAARQEKTLLAEQQLKYGSWKDRMAAALDAAAAAKRTQSTSDAGGAGDKYNAQRAEEIADKQIAKLEADRDALVGALTTAPKKGESAAITSLRNRAFGMAKLTPEEQQFLRENQGTSWYEFKDAPLRESILKKAEAAINEAHDRAIQSQLSQYNRGAAVLGDEPHPLTKQRQAAPRNPKVEQFMKANPQLDYDKAYAILKKRGEI